MINGVPVGGSAATNFQGSIDKVVQYDEVFSGPDFDQITTYLAEGWLPVGGIQYYIGFPARIESATVLELLDAVDPTGQDGFTTGGALELLDAVREKLNRGFSELGFVEDRIIKQQNYLDNVTDAMEEGVAALIEADLQEESARIQAIQVQNQLAIQSLVIANRRPETILTLFS